MIFLEDRSLERGDKVLNLLSRLSQERGDSEPDEEAELEEIVSAEED